jgi:hypothetical protein
MKLINDMDIACIRKIMENVRNWDMEDVPDLLDVLREIREKLRGTGHVLCGFIDPNTLPGMPRRAMSIPPHLGL